MNAITTFEKASNEGRLDMFEESYDGWIASNAALIQRDETIAALEADNAQLREAMGKAGIALRFYEDWMKTHEDGTRYPYGIETEQMISVLAGAR